MWPLLLSSPSRTAHTLISHSHLISLGYDMAIISAVPELYSQNIIVYDRLPQSVRWSLATTARSLSFIILFSPSVFTGAPVRSMSGLGDVVGAGPAGKREFHTGACNSHLEVLYGYTCKC